MTDYLVQLGYLITFYVLYPANLTIVVSLKIMFLT